MTRYHNLSRAPLVRLFLALIALALVYALTLAARNGLADLYARPAKNYLQDRRDEDIALTETEWQAIDVNLRRALDLAPNDPVTLTELARLHRIQLESESLDRAEFERSGESSIEYYEQAAVLRPTWPWGWSSLAEVRYELYQETGTPYHQALIHAAHFGPWEEHVQRLVAELGFDTWASLSADARQAVLNTIDRGLRRQPAEIDAIIGSEQGWQTLCRDMLPLAASRPNGGRPDNLSSLRGHCESLTAQSPSEPAN